jgi:hypothetical protein
MPLPGAYTLHLAAFGQAMREGSNEHSGRGNYMGSYPGRKRQFH